MKKVLVIVAFVACVLLTGGCDFFRSLAGRPTSADIEVKRAFIEQLELEEQARQRVRQARLDSIARAEKIVSDSLETLEAIRATHTVLSRSTLASDAVKAALPHRYYVVIGAFSDAGNASRMASKTAEAGYEAQLIRYRSGFTAVGLCASDRVKDVYDAYLVLKEQPFCPAKAWIFDTVIE